MEVRATLHRQECLCYFFGEQETKLVGVRVGVVTEGGVVKLLFICPESGLCTTPQNVEIHWVFAHYLWSSGSGLSIHKISSTIFLWIYSFRLTCFQMRILCGLKWSKVVSSRAK
jgi:hypothetical protein